MSETSDEATTDSMESTATLPRHPLFDTDQVGFTECIDALDRVRAILAFCDGLRSDEGAVSADADFGYYWVSVLMRETLTYVSHRLMALHQEAREHTRQESAYLAALAASIHSLDDHSREGLINSAAARLDVNRSAVDQFCRCLEAS